MAGGPYNIPRNTKGEVRFFNIFSGRALIETFVGFILGFIISYFITHMLNDIGFKLNTFIIDLLVAIILGAIGYAISSFKIPESNNFEITRKARRRIY